MQDHIAGRVKFRRSVTAKAGNVWLANAELDVYTKLSRSVVATMLPEVDHKLECAVVEHAFDRAARSSELSQASLDGFAAMHCRETLTDLLNSVSNLNVTTRRVNQKKKGPFVAANNRLSGRSLRVLSLEQHARAGAARELVDDGTWHHIEQAVLESGSRFGEVVQELSDDASMHADGRKLLRATEDELGRVLSLLKLQEA